MEYYSERDRELANKISIDMIQSQYENIFQTKPPELTEENPDEIERIRKLARRSLNSNFSINGFERNLLFTNQQGKFKEISWFTGIDSIADARSFALLDWDLDGTQDVVIKNVRKQLLEAYQNVSSLSNHRVAFRLIGTKSNRDAIGARLMAYTPDGVQMKQVRSAFGFVSQNQKEVYFGLGKHATLDRLEVFWPSGHKDVFTNVPTGGIVEIKEGDPTLQLEKFRLSMVLKKDPPLLLPEVDDTKKQVAPSFSKYDQKGQKIDSVSFFAQKPTVVIFLTAWCVTCKKDLRILEKSVNPSYQVLLVHVRTPEEPDLPFPEPQNLSVLGDDTTLYLKYHQNANMAFPVRFWVSQEGFILQKTLGGLEENTLDEEYLNYFSR